MPRFADQKYVKIARSFAGKCVTLPPVGSAMSPVLLLHRNLLFFCYQVFFDYVPSSATSLQTSPPPPWFDLLPMPARVPSQRK